MVGHLIPVLANGTLIWSISKIDYTQIAQTGGKITIRGKSMSRIIKTIEIEGQPVKALFDTGAFHSYVLRKCLSGVPDRMVPVAKPYEVALGGETIKIQERALINGKIEGLDFDTSVVPVESLGKANGHDLDAIIGAITMEAWEITVNPKDGTLGLEGLRRREFTEY
jgi:hypothetical protein